MVPLAIFAKSASESIPCTDAGAVAVWDGAGPEEAGTPQVVVGILLGIFVVEGTSGFAVLTASVL